MILNRTICDQHQMRGTDDQSVKDLEQEEQRGRMEVYAEKPRLAVGLDKLEFDYKFKKSSPRTFPASFAHKIKLPEILALTL